MTVEREALRDWHRLFGLLLTDFFTGLPFIVEVERDLSELQQFLDVVIVRRGRGRTAIRLPDGLRCELPAVENEPPIQVTSRGEDGCGCRAVAAQMPAPCRLSARRQ